MYSDNSRYMGLGSPDGVSFIWSLLDMDKPICLKRLSPYRPAHNLPITGAVFVYKNNQLNHQLNTTHNDLNMAGLVTVSPDYSLYTY